MKKIQKLSLTKETLRNLTPDQLASVAGAAGGPVAIDIDNPPMTAPKLPCERYTDSCPTEFEITCGGWD